MYTFYTKGKIFLLLFSIIGLPTTLLLLYAIIDRLMKLKVRFMSYFTERALRITNNIPALKHVVKHSHVHVFFAIFSAVVVLIFLLVIPAGIYAHIEGWAYLDAFYYCFISLTTVGLGKILLNIELLFELLNFLLKKVIIYLVMPTIKHFVNCTSYARLSTFYLGLQSWCGFWKHSVKHLSLTFTNISRLLKMGYSQITIETLRQMIITLREMIWHVEEKVTHRQIIVL